MSIRVGETVTYSGDTTQGTVKDLWRGKRAYVAWADGQEAWVPLASLSPVALANIATTSRRCEECGKPIPGRSSADDIADGRMPGYCANC